MTVTTLSGKRTPQKKRKSQKRPWGLRKRLLRKLYQAAGITNSHPTYRYIPTADLQHIIGKLLEE